jgi:hypothetical protein
MTEQASLLERIAAAPHREDTDAALLADLVAWLRPRPRERGSHAVNARLGSLLQVLRTQPQLA